MPNGSSSAPYTQLGSEYQGSLLWLQGTTANGATFYSSAVRLNSEDALTAAHNVESISSGYYTIDQVGTGTNYLTDPGTTRFIDSYMIYPGFPHDGNFFTPDIAILHFSQPLPGTNVTLGSWPAVGEVLTAAGFGAYGTPSTGILGQDGNSRGWEAAVDDGGSTMSLANTT